MKKSQFEGWDLACVERFKEVNIQKLNSREDLDDFAQKKLDEKYKLEQYSNGNLDDTKERLVRIQCWIEYLTRDNNVYDTKPVLSLIIFDSITKNVKPNNHEQPPLLNPGVLAQTVEQIEKDKNYDANFGKTYQNNLRMHEMGSDDDMDTGETETKWIKIPSKRNDPENFEKNIGKLKTLSHRSWCTKTTHAEEYLSKGDFHVYLENGKPKAGIRFIKNNIEEIQGELNNSVIPVKYLDVIEGYIKENDFNTTEIEENLENARETAIVFEKLKKEIAEIPKDKNQIDKILEKCGIEVTYEDGKRMLSEYKQPHEGFTYSDLGINENDLVKDVYKIKGNAYFKNSKATDLSSLKTIGGSAHFNKSKVTDLSSLETIGGYAYFQNSKVTDLSSLESIGKDAYFKNSQVTDLSRLETIGGYAWFQNSQVTDLSSLKTIGEDADFRKSQVTNLSSLKTIGGDAHFENSKVTDLSSLESIGKNAYFYNSQVIDLCRLETIGKHAWFENSKVRSVPSLIKVVNDVYIKDSYLTPDDFKNVEIGGEIITE